jgi:thiosulfate dehydrogenase
MTASAWVGTVTAATLILISVACGDRDRPEPGRAGVKQTGDTTPRHALWDSAAWRPPALTELPDDSLGRAVRRGLALVAATRDSLPRFVGSNLNCTSCHLDDGRRANAAPLSGVFARYPKYLERTGAVIPIEDRVNYCFTRSLAGSRLPSDSREMQDMVAYLAFLSRGVPIGAHVAGEGMPPMPKLAGDSARGAVVFVNNCARCHGTDGVGIANVPALWGAKSFSIGASMARQERAASFIRHNMPFDKPGTLSDQEAFDVAVYLTARARPDSPGKERDWPLGGAPADVPYDTKGHKAHRPPPLLPRRDPSGAIVPAPRSVSARTAADR